MHEFGTILSIFFCFLFLVISLKFLLLRLKKFNDISIFATDKLHQISLESLFFSKRQNMLKSNKKDTIYFTFQ